MNFRTDLALENCEYIQDNSPDALAGVEISTREDDAIGMTATWVQINDERGAKSLGKPVGNYITLECAAMQTAAPEVHEVISKNLAKELAKLHPLSSDSVILVVGLGNWQVTPDALGPRVSEKILVTRHLGEAIPPELHGRTRSVSVLRPGVMGLTGIETAEIILGVAERVKPDLLIAVDALAARKTSRINSTIQLCDTGISPGAGLGNNRTPINRESVGVPVLAVGVPTVVSATTLVEDALEDFLAELPEEQRERFMKNAVCADIGGMFVTPKDVDAVIARLAGIIANALNMALHPGLDAGDIGKYLG